MGTKRYARSAEQARAFRAALRAWLFCPHCGVSDAGCLAQRRSMSAVVMKCDGCGLKYYVRREELAASARRLADDPREAQLYERLAAIFHPDAAPQHLYPVQVPERE